MNREMIWPNSAQAAAMVTVELDNEFIWTSISDEYDTPKNRSMGTYGTTRGLDRILDSLTRYNIRATFFVPGIFAEQYPEKLKQVAAAGHEIALHGYKHEDFGGLSAEEQAAVLKKGAAALQKVTGKKPVGFRLPEGSCTPETLAIIHKEGFLYDSSFYDHDLPYQVQFDGKKSGLIEIPFRWELHDFPYFAFGPHFTPGGSRIAIYDDVLENWLCELDAVYDMGFCYVIKFDPQTIGSPGRIFMVDKVLELIARRNMWAATGEEIALHVKA